MSERRSEKSSEKILAWLIIIAVVISLTGTFFSLNMLNELERYKQYFAGYATTGQVNLTITQNLTINVVQDVINFSSGYVNTGDTGAYLNTSATGYWASNPRPAWTNTTDYDPRPMQVKNEGNVNSSLNISSGEDAATFLGGTSPLYQFNGSQMEANSCMPNMLVSVNTSLTGSSQILCSNFGTAETRDDIYVHCFLWVPSDAIGVKEDIWTFTAVANLTG